jgi:hypothetical protein
MLAKDEVTMRVGNRARLAVITIGTLYLYITFGIYFRT